MDPTFDQDHCKKNYQCSANYISDIFGFWVSWVLEIRRMWPQPPPAGCPPRPPRTLLVYQLSLSEEGALIRGSPQRSTVAPSDGSTYLIDIPRASNRSPQSHFLLPNDFTTFLGTTCTLRVRRDSRRLFCTAAEKPTVWYQLRVAAQPWPDNRFVAPASPQ